MEQLTADSSPPLPGTPYFPQPPMFLLALAEGASAGPLGCAGTPAPLCLDVGHDTGDTSTILAAFSTEELLQFGVVLSKLR